MSPPAWVKSKDWWRGECRRLRARCGDLVEGRLELLAAARIINSYAVGLRATEDPDFKIFAAIVSKTRDLPLGHVRQHWEPEALKKQDEKIREAIANYHEMKAAENLRGKY